jgi:hypothetical protein
MTLYVLAVWKNDEGRLYVRIYQTLAEARAALRAMAAEIWVGLADSEIVDQFVDKDTLINMFECSGINGTEISPFPFEPRRAA